MINFENEVEYGLFHTFPGTVPDTCIIHEWSESSRLLDFEDLTVITMFALIKGFSGDSRVKNLPTMQKKQVRSLDREDLLEEEMATHPSIPAWRIPWTEGPGGLGYRVSKSCT